MAVFPTLHADVIPTATPDTIPDWDSIATVNLVAVAEEEFGIQLDVDHLENLGSFEALLATIEQQIGDVAN